MQFIFSCFKLNQSIHFVNGHIQIWSLSKVLIQVALTLNAFGYWNFYKIKTEEALLQNRNI